MNRIIPRITFTALWLADTALTCVFVSAGGTELEANPLLRSLMESHGLLAFVAVKLAIMEAGMILYNRGWNHPWVPISLWVVNAIMLGVVGLGVALTILL